MRTAGKTGRLVGSAAALTLLVSSVAADQSAATGVTPPADDRGSRPTAIQNNPNNSTRNDIRKRLVTLVNGAKAGSTITAASYHLDDAEIADALVGAAQRGIKLRLLIDGHDHDTDAYGRVEGAIEAQPDSTGSTISHCGTGGSKNNKMSSCMGDHIMHNKFFLFSDSTRPEVVVQTSANLNADSGPKMWNTAYITSDRWLYQAHVKYFDALAAVDPDRPKPVNKDFFSEFRPSNQKFRLSVSPRAKGNTLLDALDSVRCGGNTSGGTDNGHRTIVRVATMQIAGKNGTRIAKRLRDLDNEGCFVDIVAGELEPPARGKKKPLSYLLEKPQGKYHGPEVRAFSPAQCSVHQKNILIDGHYDGRPNQKIVLTGSHNMNNKSARHNDESVLQINDSAMHQQFKKFFFTLRANAAITWQTSKFDVEPKRDPEFNCG